MKNARAVINIYINWAFDEATNGIHKKTKHSNKNNPAISTNNYRFSVYILTLIII